jgi:UDP-glucose 4-epimerase
LISKTRDARSVATEQKIANQEMVASPLVWVSGASGFIGRHLVRALLDSRSRVVGFCRKMPAEPQTGLVELFEGGLDTAGLNQALLRHGPPDLVYHFAGGRTVGASFENPLSDFESSVLATARLLDVLRCAAPSVPVVLASSAAVYGKGQSGPIQVSAPLAPLSPYGHHKQLAEQLAQSYAETYGMRITVLRLFSIYGPEIGKQLIFDLCTLLAAGHDPLTLGGTGRELRDWCHVSDVVRLCLELQPATVGQPNVFNVGSGTGTVIAEVARLTREAWGSRVAVVFSGQSRPGDPFSLIAERASLPVGFSPKVALGSGLEDFVRWFRNKDVPRRAD